MFIGNLNVEITTADLIELFGFNKIKYLQENCFIDLPSPEKFKRAKGFAFVTAPEHVCSELVSLNGFEFQGNYLLIEPAKEVKEQFHSHETNIHYTNDNSASNIDSAILENQAIEKNLKRVVPGEKSYSKALIAGLKKNQNTVIFTDSLPKGIRMRELNSFLKNDEAAMINFPGATSHQINGYIDVNMEGKFYENCVIHAGINDIMENPNLSVIDQLKQNITNIIKKCQSYGIKNIFLSGIVFSTRVNLDLLEKTHIMLLNLCKSFKCSYIDNRNIRRNCLSDGLHLLESGKRQLANNFIFNLNKHYMDFPPHSQILGS